MAAERKKKSLAKRYDRLVNRIAAQRDKKLGDLNKQREVLEEKLKNAKEGYLKTVANAKVTDITTKIASMEENEVILKLQIECENECKLVEDDFFGDISSDSSIGSDLEAHLDKLKEDGHELAHDLSSKLAEKESNAKKKIREKKLYDEYNISYYAKAKGLLLASLEKYHLKMSEETWGQYEALLKQQKKHWRSTVDMMEIRFAKVLAIYAGDFSEIQKEMKYELTFQYSQNIITEAKRKAELEFAAIETVRESFGGCVTQTCHNSTQNCHSLTRNCNPRATLKKSFDEWKTWVRDKKRRVRRDLRYHWRRVMRGFEAVAQTHTPTPGIAF